MEAKNEHKHTMVDLIKTKNKKNEKIKNLKFKI